MLVKIYMLRHETQERGALVSTQEFLLQAYDHGRAVSILSAEGAQCNEHLLSECLKPVLLKMSQPESFTVPLLLSLPCPVSCFLLASFCLIVRSRVLKNLPIN